MTLSVGFSFMKTHANRAVTKGAVAQINETFATLVNLNAGMNAAVPEAPRTAAKNAGLPKRRISSLTPDLISKYTNVNAIPLRPRQKMTSHAVASTDFVNIPAVLKARADKHINMIPRVTFENWFTALFQFEF